jgi:hypothetical protein
MLLYRVRDQVLHKSLTSAEQIACQADCWRVGVIFLVNLPHEVESGG